ncbi:MAG: indolepyruvate oxidoreductase [Calditrichaeota bacterium]|nr:MAG: indolepyruvate oxidoreductase [Calditrichota bacterium]MBL1207777.1 indolepyruvate oxidoreductase [Calditrichota bacterium]NOG47610.1 indolepyruvate oxidoreductase subunit beta [Calditrichota bacterium]
MKNDNTFGLVVAGVGGQGAVTIAQLVLGAAWMSGLHVLQSEVHGMSQRGGEVSAHIMISKKKVTSPTIEKGTGDLLIGLEPLEALRHLVYLKKGAPVVSTTTAIVNMDSYPEVDRVNKLLSGIDGVKMIDSESLSKEMRFPQAGTIALLGAAATYLPITDKIWEKVIQERFASKGEKVIEKNMRAFMTGKELILQ